MLSLFIDSIIIIAFSFMIVCNAHKVLTLTLLYLVVLKIHKARLVSNSENGANVAV